MRRETAVRETATRLPARVSNRRLPLTYTYGQDGCYLYLEAGILVSLYVVAQPSAQPSA